MKKRPWDNPTGLNDKNLTQNDRNFIIVSHLWAESQQSKMTKLGLGPILTLRNRLKGEGVMDHIMICDSGDGGVGRIVM